MERKNVLIVGDDDLIAWAIRKRCNAMHVPVRIVGTPEEALSDLREDLYGLVVFDPSLLEGKDPAILQKFHGVSGTARTSHLPGSGISESAREGGTWTGIRFVEKPQTIFDLDRVVEGMIGRFSEKRMAPRYLCNLPVSIFLQEEDREGKGSEWGHPTGVAAEASEEGLRVFTSHILVPGQRLQLAPLSVHNPLARFIRRDQVAEVVWVVPDDNGVIAGIRYLA